MIEKGQTCIDFIIKQQLGETKSERIFCELINHTTKQNLPLSNSVEVPSHRCQTQAGKLLPGTVINSLIHTTRLFCSVANRWYIESETRSKSRLRYVRSCPFADGRGRATGYARYVLAYPADPACIGVYILYLKKKTLTCGLEN